MQRAGESSMRTRANLPTTIHHEVARVEVALASAQTAACKR